MTNQYGQDTRIRFDSWEAFKKYYLERPPAQITIPKETPVVIEKYRNKLLHPKPRYCCPECGDPLKRQGGDWRRKAEPRNLGDGLLRQRCDACKATWYAKSLSAELHARVRSERYSRWDRPFESRRSLSFLWVLSGALTGLLLPFVPVLIDKLSQWAK